jgi:hypothetical protein
MFDSWRFCRELRPRSKLRLPFSPATLARAHRRACRRRWLLWRCAVGHALLSRSSSSRIANASSPLSSFQGLNGSSVGNLSKPSVSSTCVSPGSRPSNSCRDSRDNNTRCGSGAECPSLEAVKVSGAVPAGGVATQRTAASLIRVRRSLRWRGPFRVIRVGLA